MLCSQESSSEDDDDETPMSYKALLSKSRKEGRIIPQTDDDAVFDVDDEVIEYCLFNSQKFESFHRNELFLFRKATFHLTA